MKKIKVGSIMLIGVLVVLMSCKKEGCTDEEAFNYNEAAKTV